MRLWINHRDLWRKLERMEESIMATAAGLTALTTAVSDLTAAVSAAVTELGTLSAQLSALNSEDPAVAALATQIDGQVTALKNAVTPPTV